MNADREATQFGEHEALSDRITAALAVHRREAAGNPFVNPVQMLAQDIAGWLRLDAVNAGDLGGVVDGLTAEAFEARARDVVRYLGEIDPEENRQRLRACVATHLAEADGESVPFETFAAAVAREWLGLVITAHPTFGTSARLIRRLAGLAAGDETLRDGLASEAHRPDEGITLAFEFDLALEALSAIQDAVRSVYEAVFDCAMDRYPERWHEVQPRLLTVASWVGFDLDGRSDVTWADSLGARFRLKVAQLERYAARLSGLAARVASGSPEEVALDLARSRIELGLTVCRADLLLLPEEPREVSALGAYVKHVRRSEGSRLVHLRDVMASLDKALEVAADQELKRDLLVLRAEMATYGLGAAHIHVRLNAQQLHNAVRHHVTLERTPDQASTRRRYLTAINDLLDRVTPVAVNMPVMAAEPTTAKRLFMLIVHILRLVDGETSIRFLIAEAGTAFTVLTAVYYARLFGVEEHVDISPLFETDAALERGADMMAELIRNPHYRRMVERRGRLCIQTGYSDAGRFLGQPAAAMAIERLRMKLARVLEQEGLTHLELVIFDTSGESIGRGGHPASLADRVAYLAPPESRALFAGAGIQVKQEFSFQGGDGYLYFNHPNLALAAISRLVESILPPSAPVGQDPVYSEIDYSLDFFLGIREANRLLMEDRDYPALLSVFGANLLYPTGSRMLKRQHEAKSAVDMEHPSQLRAIPHNAILQQLGYLANSVYGVGTAAAADLERFLGLACSSDRFRRIVALVDEAARRSSLDVLGAYLALLDPSAWIKRLAVEQDAALIRRMHRLIRHLEARGRHTRLQAAWRRIAFDGLDLQRSLAPLAVGEHSVADERRRDALDQLHAIRIALIQETLILAMRIPRFTNQPDVTADEILDEVMKLAIPHALNVLDRAFPKEAAAVPDLDGEVEATYRLDGSQGYAREHDEVFKPIGDLYALARRITTPVAYWNGAVG